VVARVCRRGVIWSLLASVTLCIVGAADSVLADGATENFATLAKRVTAHPEDLSAGNDLRSLCRAQKAIDPCIEFFDQLVSEQPQVRAARYNAALAYIDKLPGNSLLVQARLSTHSIEHASAVLAQSADDWMALYIRGLNNLYWPKWYRRVPRAVEDLSHCVRLSEGLPAAQRKPYMALAYVALGDAYVKLEQLEQARQTWQGGLRTIGESGELRQRLEIATQALPQKIEQLRSRDAPVDTDLQPMVMASRP
jgi:tetratricopeptide (TPR) repeat protein